MSPSEEGIHDALDVLSETVRETGPGNKELDEARQALDSHLRSLDTGAQRRMISLMQTLADQVRSLHERANALEAQLADEDD